MNEKDFDNMPAKEVVDYITITFHDSVKNFFTEVSPHVEILTQKYPDIIDLKELYNQFKTKLSNHMNKEDVIVFHDIIKYEEFCNR